MAMGEGLSGVGTSSTTGAHRDVMCLVTALSSAACEWLLLFLLFIHGLLSYFLREFASYCKLPTPCFICSRLDHYFSDTKPESYQSMFCKNHGHEIFSRVMCDRCLVSCYSKKVLITAGSPRLQRNNESVCHLDKSINSCNEQLSSGLVGRRVCSCCGKVWSSRRFQRGTIRYRSPVRGLSKPNIPLPNEPSQKVSNFRSNMRRKREKSYGSLYANHLLDTLMDHQVNIGYKAAKVTSDSESDAPFSDSGVGKIMLMEANIDKEDNAIRRTSLSLADAQSNILANLKPGGKISTPANPGADEVVTELSLSGGVRNSSAPAFPELISLDDSAHISNRSNEDLPCETTGKASKTSLNLTSTSVIQPSIFSVADPCPSTKQVEMFVKESPEKSASINRENREVFHHLDTLSATFTSVEDKVDNDTPFEENELQASSLSDSNKGLETSTLIVKDKDMECHNGVKDESQLSSTVEEFVPVTNLQSKGRNSRSLDDNENSNHDITCGSVECMTPREAASSEKNESAFESTAGSVVSDREGESLVDRLKRQIEYHKKRIASLYNELDEERNASAIAANEAMAMISRLQEEKAALNMEALHYLKMMEEQAEYDVEALEKANDLLSEKEKEIQDLESVLEHSRSKKDQRDQKRSNVV